jgi:prepilin-type N-terminal cleavage/methylation domain-containing protein
LGVSTDPERRLLVRGAMARRLRSHHGFTLIELLTVVAIIGILASVAIGVTPGIIATTKASSNTAQLTSFLKRTREMAISRRRNIEIRFLAPNQVQSAERAVPNPPAPTPAPTVLETMTFEGRLGYNRFGGQPDTPDAFGNAAAINLGGANPVMFTSEGSFADVNGDPVNATVMLGVPGDPTTANAVTILGTTAAVRAWRYDGSRWVQ